MQAFEQEIGRFYMYTFLSTFSPHNPFRRQAGARQLLGGADTALVSGITSRLCGFQVRVRIRICRNLRDCLFDFISTSFFLNLFMLLECQ